MTTGAVAAVLAATAVVVVGLVPARARVRPLESAPGPAAARSASRWSRAPLLGAVLLVGAGASAVLVVGPTWSLVLVGSAALARVEAVRRVRRRRQRASDAAFPDLVDLFRIAGAAGHPVHRCLELVAERAPAPVRAPLADALARAHRGVPLAEALAALGPQLGSSGPVLTDALEAALRTGSPLGPVLDRVVVVARDRRTRASQAAARRLPVTMLFPLVCCVLPAFGLLAVVPLLAGSLGSLAP